MREVDAAGAEPFAGPLRPCLKTPKPHDVFDRTARGIHVVNEGLPQRPQIGFALFGDGRSLLLYCALEVSETSQTLSETGVVVVDGGRCVGGFLTGMGSRDVLIEEVCGRSTLLALVAAVAGTLSAAGIAALRSTIRIQKDLLCDGRVFTDLRGRPVCDI